LIPDSLSRFPFHVKVAQRVVSVAHDMSGLISK